MRIIPAPLEDPCQVFGICVGSVASQALRERLIALTSNICTSAIEYQHKATVFQLYKIPSIECRKNDVVVGGVTRKELTDVYSTHMVGKKKPARRIYDELLSRAPSGRCPFCGIGQASTLDHFLPKAKFPLLSVVPLNLVPSCKDCNVGKGYVVATTAGTQSLHPYFDQRSIVDEQWLFAEVMQTSPATIKYYISAPEHWDTDTKKQVQSHFKNFELSSRYSIEASDEITHLTDVLRQTTRSFGIGELKLHLEAEATTRFKRHRNSWQTAMYQALADSDWFCDGGFIDAM